MSRCTAGCVLFLFCMTEIDKNVKCVGISTELCIYSYKFGKRNR